MLIPSFSLMHGALNQACYDNIERGPDEERLKPARLFAGLADAKSANETPALKQPSRSSAAFANMGSQVVSSQSQGRSTYRRTESSGSTSAPPSPNTTRDSAYQPPSPVYHLFTSSHQDRAIRRSFLCISEPDILPHGRVPQQNSAQPPKSLRACVSDLAGRARAALLRVRTSLRVAPPMRISRRLSTHSQSPRVSLYHTRHSAESSACESVDIFPLPSDDETSPLPMPGAWLEPKGSSSLADFHSIRARPLSWPSIMPLSPDLPCETADSTLDFRAAADLVRDYHSMDSLPALQRDDRDEDTSDTASLRTPLRSHAPAPFGDFALRSTWSDSDTDSDAESELDCDFSSIGCDGAAALAGVAFPRLAGERVSVASLSLFPSPPGTPAFGERFGARSPEEDSPATPKRPRRGAMPHPYTYAAQVAVVEPESPTVRTARIRRETLARLESRI